MSHLLCNGSNNSKHYNTNTSNEYCNVVDNNSNKISNNNDIDLDNINYVNHNCYKPISSVLYLNKKASLTETYSLIRIGSDPKSDLVISNSNPAEPVIAKTHCWLELRRLNNKNRTVFHNGPNKRTYVEGKLMEPHQQYLLKDGDRILVKCKDGYIVINFVEEKTDDDNYDDCDNKIETMLLIRKKNILFTNKLINSKNPILKQEELKNYKDELKLIKSVDCGRVLSLADQHFDDDSVVQVHFQKGAIQYNIRPLQCSANRSNNYSIRKVAMVAVLTISILVGGFFQFF